MFTATSTLPISVLQKAMLYPDVVRLANDVENPDEVLNAYKFAGLSDDEMTLCHALAKELYTIRLSSPVVKDQYASYATKVPGITELGHLFSHIFQNGKEFTAYGFHSISIKDFEWDLNVYCRLSCKGIINGPITQIHLSSFFGSIETATQCIKNPKALSRLIDLPGIPLYVTRGEKSPLVIDSMLTHCNELPLTMYEANLEKYKERHGREHYSCPLSLDRICLTKRSLTTPSGCHWTISKDVKGLPNRWFQQNHEFVDGRKARLPDRGDEFYLCYGENEVAVWGHQLRDYIEIGIDLDSRIHNMGT